MGRKWLYYGSRVHISIYIVNDVPEQGMNEIDIVFLQSTLLFSAIYHFVFQFLFSILFSLLQLVSKPIIPWLKIQKNHKQKSKKSELRKMEHQLFGKSSEGPGIFDGTDPQGWILRAEDYFNFMLVDESKKVEFAEFYFEGRAKTWYTCYYDTRYNEKSEWKQFLYHLLIRFVKVDEFLLSNKINPLNITQYGSVGGYELNFLQTKELAEIIYDFTFTEEMLVLNFVSGLKEEIREAIVLWSPQTLQGAINLAKFQELEREEELLFEVNEEETELFNAFQHLFDETSVSKHQKQLPPDTSVELKLSAITFNAMDLKSNSIKSAIGNVLCWRTENIEAVSEKVQKIRAVIKGRVLEFNGIQTNWRYNLELANLNFIIDPGGLLPLLQNFMHWTPYTPYIIQSCYNYNAVMFSVNIYQSIDTNILMLDPWGQGSFQERGNYESNMWSCFGILWNEISQSHDEASNVESENAIDHEKRSEDGHQLFDELCWEIVLVSWCMLSYYIKQKCCYIMTTTIINIPMLHDLSELTCRKNNTTRMEKVEVEWKHVSYNLVMETMHEVIEGEVKPWELVSEDEFFLLPSVSLTLVLRLKWYYKYSCVQYCTCCAYKCQCITRERKLEGMFPAQSLVAPRAMIFNSNPLEALLKKFRSQILRNICHSYSIAANRLLVCGVLTAKQLARDPKNFEMAKLKVVFPIEVTSVEDLQQLLVMIKVLDRNNVPRLSCTKGFWCVVMKEWGLHKLVRLPATGQSNTQAIVCFLLACIRMEDASVASILLVAEATKQLHWLLELDNESSVRAEAAGTLKSLSSQCKEATRKNANVDGIPALLRATIAPSKIFMPDEHAQALQENFMSALEDISGGLLYEISSLGGSFELCTSPAQLRDTLMVLASAVMINDSKAETARSVDHVEIELIPIKEFKPRLPLHMECTIGALVSLYGNAIAYNKLAIFYAKHLLVGLITWVSSEVHYELIRSLLILRNNEGTSWHTFQSRDGIQMPSLRGQLTAQQQVCAIALHSFLCNDNDESKWIIASTHELVIRLVQDGFGHFKSVSRFGTEPGIEPFDCMVPLLRKAGELILENGTIWTNKFMQQPFDPGGRKIGYCFKLGAKTSLYWSILEDKNVFEG